MLKLTTGTAIALTITVTGCGGSGEPKNFEPKGKPDPAAARTAQQYVDAYTALNAKKVCSLVASSALKTLGGKACPRTVKASFNKGTFPKFTVKQSYVEGETAVVTFENSQRQVTLQREGGDWKVSNGGT